MFSDIRYAFRTLRQNPGFALVAILSLALGIGANSAIFSFVDAMLLRPLPVPRASRVVAIVSQTRGERFGGLSYKDYLDIRNKNTSFEGLAAFQLTQFGFATSKHAGAQMKTGFLVSGDCFRVLDVEPELGRSFRPDEDRVPGRDAVTVISHDLWESDFGTSRDVIGRTVFLNGISFTIVGVAPRTFTGVDHFFRPALFVPMMMAARLAGNSDQSFLERRGDRPLTVKGRLKPGVSGAEADAEVKVLAKQLEQAYPDTNRNVTALAKTEFQLRVNQSPFDAMLMASLLALVGVVLLIACANVANLLLSRGRARSREFAVRLAIGAGRGRIVRQLLTESLVIALLGGALGLLLAEAGIEAISPFKVPGEIPLQVVAQLDLRVTLYALLASIASAVLFGMAPALQAVRSDLVSALKSGAEGVGKKSRFLGRNALVIAQVAGSLVLLVCATQLLRATSFLLSAPPSFRADHMLMVSFDPTVVRYSSAQTQLFYRRLLEQTRALPGVKSAALSRLVPMSNFPIIESIVPEGYQMPPGKESIDMLTNTVSEDYFGTLNVPILKGRGFKTTDDESAPRVAVVSEQFARHYFPKQDPVGKRFRLGSLKGTPVEIVGLAKQSKYFFLGEPRIEAVYRPLAQNPQTPMTLMAQSRGDSASLAQPVREVVRSLDPDQPVNAVRTMEEYFDLRARKTFTFLTGITGMMGLLGLILALVGLYGLMTYSVSRRMREIGIRMAIGADRVNVVTMVLKHGLLLAGIGIAIGLLLSFSLSRALTAAVGAPSFDLTMLTLVSAALLAAAALGAYVPARRASMVDPMRVLRQD